MTTEIYCVRHGQSIHNQQQTIAGQLDSELTPLGFEDARSVAAAIGRRDFEIVYCSDLLRARQTADFARTKAQPPGRARRTIGKKFEGCFKGRDEWNLNTSRVHRLPNLISCAKAANTAIFLDTSAIGNLRHWGHDNHARNGRASDNRHCFWDLPHLASRGCKLSL